MNQRRGGDEYNRAYFLNPLVEDFGATLDALRASLPNFVSQLHYYADDDNSENVWDDYSDERRPDTPRPAGEDNGLSADLVQRLVRPLASAFLITSDDV